MGEGRPPSPALSAVSAMCCCSWRALPSFSSSGVSSELSRVPNHRLGALPFVLSYRTRKDRNMPDKSITKVSSEYAPRAASGRSISPPEFIFQCVFGNVSSQMKKSRRPPAITRRSDCPRERPSCILKANSCYWKKAIIRVVPKGSRHTYKVIETFTAVEATSPPAEVHGRDE